MDGSRESKSNSLASDCGQKVSLHVSEVPATLPNLRPFDWTLIGRRVLIFRKVFSSRWLAVPKKAPAFLSSHPTGGRIRLGKKAIRKAIFARGWLLAPIAQKRIDCWANGDYSLAPAREFPVARPYVRLTKRSSGP